MKTFTLFSAALVVLWATVMPVPTNAAAAPIVRSAIGAPLSDALQAIHIMDFASALEKVRLADRVNDKSPFEEYSVARYLGFIALAQQIPDYAAARAAYSRMVASRGMPNQDKAAVQEFATKLGL